MADKNTSYTLKRRIPKERQEFTRNYNQSNIPLYSLEKVNKLDWKLFMWFALLEKVENYVCLFIATWDSIPLSDVEFKELPKESIDIDMDYQSGSIKFATLLREFREETSIMIQIIEYLKISDYSKILDDYRNCRKPFENNQNNQNLRRIIVNNAWAELEEYGLDKYSHAVELQIKRCTFAQKRELRFTISSRMNSFRSYATEKIKENEKLIKENEELIKRNEELMEKVNGYMEENSKQQAALGNLTNVSWNDDDPNNTKNLNSDIVDLQDMLSDFAMVQGLDYKIIDGTAEDLLKMYKCQKYDKKAKNVLGTILQRHAIETILGAAKEYLDRPSEGGDQQITIENNIVNTIETLIKHTELFNNIREGEDDITKITPIKIRQHVYSALSCRGLSKEHSLIKETAKKLLDEMNKYREVIDEYTRDGLNDQAIQITHRVINIFYFRLKTQAREPTYRFFQAGDDIDSHFMEGGFDAKKLEVEACGFPCIGIFDGDKPDQKVFTKAQVITRPKSSNKSQT